MAAEKQANILTEGLKELRETVESKFAETGEAKEKISKIEKDLGDIHEKNQKKFEEEAEKTKAFEAEVKELKSNIDSLVKQNSRITVGTSTQDQEDAIYKKYSANLKSYFRKGTVMPQDVLDEVAKDIVERKMEITDERDMREQKSLLVGNDPNGGYLIFPQRRAQPITRVFETSPVRSVASIETINSDELRIPIDDEEFSSGGWVGEVGTRSDTDNSTLGELTIATHEHYAMPKATQKMLDDASFDVEGWIRGKIERKFTREENTAFVAGTGAASPKGFLSYDAWTTNSSPGVQGVYERNKLEQINSGTSGVVTADGILDLTNALLQDYDANAVFMMKRNTWGAIKKLKDGSGRYLLNVEILPEGAGMMLEGKRVLFANDMPVITADSLSIAYGDFGVGYTIVDRLGIRVLRDPFTSKPYIRFYTIKRVGGAVTNYDAIKIQKLAA